MAKAPKPRTADQVLAEAKRDRTTHLTVGARINLEATEQTLNIRLAQWALSPDAVLAWAEVDNLIAALKAAKAKRFPKAAAPADDFDPEEFA